jgi:hypothetical protein
MLSKEKFELATKFETMVEEWFDFKKVRKHMKRTNWIWYTTGDVPTVAEMKDACWTLFEEALCNYSICGSPSACSSGGFEVTIDNYGVSLRFVVAGVDSCELE